MSLDWPFLTTENKVSHLVNYHLSGHVAPMTFPNNNLLMLPLLSHLLGCGLSLPSSFPLLGGPLLRSQPLLLLLVGGDKRKENETLPDQQRVRGGRVFLTSLRLSSCARFLCSCSLLSFSLAARSTSIFRARAFSRS